MTAMPAMPAQAQTTPSVLDASMLARFAQRAPAYDRENRFFDEDFAELRDAGYLKLAIPKDLGGGGLTLADVAREQGRLAYYAPATALAVNMHLYWTGVAADLRRQGDTSLEWLLR
ncbi:MAG TPA: acyl-CoA dehydrogenase family protein, partial [Myxococcota bacterium]|nr:acyl-CoA dehydrogenase family protein [Myxococcota bacterium]